MKTKHYEIVIKVSYDVPKNHDDFADKLEKNLEIGLASILGEVDGIVADDIHVQDINEVTR